MLNEDPLSPEEGEALLGPLLDGSTSLLAVSGGPDSIALLHLAAKALPPSRLAVASVDHGLREGSRAVAEAVVARAMALGLPAHVLSWDGPKPTTGLQEAARDARYALLVAEARRIGASQFVTAHTIDDQAETVLFRLMRGSGTAGLSGMRARRIRDGILHLRPLLDVPKARLVATCRVQGWRYVTDLANADLRFARARLRALMPRLAEEGLDARGLARFARRIGEADAVVETVAAALVEASRTGTDLYDAQRLAAASPAALHRALELILAERQAARRPPLERLERFAGDLRAAVAARQPLRRTLHGTLLAYDGAGELSIQPEPPRRAGSPPRQESC